MRKNDKNTLQRSSVRSDQPFDVIDGISHRDNEDCSPGNFKPFAQRAFPPDTTAIIYRPARSARTSGKANIRSWKLRFEQRAASFIEPLMGWTGGTDTLSQVELDFPSAEAAVAYAKRQHLNIVVQADKLLTTEVPECRPCTRKLEWMERTLGLRATNNGIDLDRALTHPVAVFDDPEQVVRHPQLSAEQKREVLRRWALEESYSADRARSQAAEPPDSSRLDRLIDALIDLEEPAGLVIRGKPISSGGARAA
jgi:hypothetical protein